MPSSVRHLTPVDLVKRWHLDDEDDSTKRGEQYLADLRSKRDGPAFIRVAGSGRKAKILYREADVEAYEESRLVKTSAA